MFRFAQRLATILDVNPERRAQLDRYDLELEDAIGADIEQHTSLTVLAAESITFETTTSTSIPVYISTPKVNPANPHAGAIVFYLDEVGDNLMVNVTYSNNTTTKTATIPLT